MDVVEKGDSVTIHYTLTFKNGIIYDSTQNKESVSFTVGNNAVIPGIEKAVLGMSEGQHKRITLPPEDAFGPRHDDLVLMFKLSDIPSHIDCEVGKRIEIRQEDMPPFIGSVTEKTDTMIVVDGNLPMSGREMILYIELVQIY